MATALSLDRQESLSPQRRHVRKRRLPVTSVNELLIPMLRAREFTEAVSKPFTLERSPSELILDSSRVVADKFPLVS